MLNGLKLFANELDAKATFYSCFTNFGGHRSADKLQSYVVGAGHEIRKKDGVEQVGLSDISDYYL